MLDPHELHFDLIEYLQEFRKHLANSGTGELHDEPGLFPVAVLAHKQASDLLATLESSDFEENVLP